MTAGDRQSLLQATIAAVRDCADKMEDRATSLLQSLPTVPMDEGLRATAIELSAGLKDASGRVMFELALLQTELGEAKADAATALQSLSRMDATMMDALAAIADVADQLENAAERDERNERAFVLVIEAAGVMLQSLEKARAATQLLSAAGQTAVRT
jgi:hypothetical protein